MDGSIFNKMGHELFYIGVVGIVAGGAVFSIPSYFIGKNSGVKDVVAKAHVEFADLRLAERKVPAYALPQREDVFSRQIVPFLNLKRDSLDYKVLHTACTTGIYGSNANDFNVDASNVKATFEACGWPTNSNR